MLTALVPLANNPGAYSPPAHDAFHTVVIPLLAIIVGLIFTIYGGMRWAEQADFIGVASTVTGVLSVAVVIVSIGMSLWNGSPADQYRAAYITHTQQWLRVDYDITANRDQVTALVDGKARIAETRRGVREIHLTPDTNGHLVVVLPGGAILSPEKR
jgi:hypothetical protein